MSEKQFVVNELEILNEENEWKGEYWWAVTNTERIEDSFECRNKEVAIELCAFLNKAVDDIKYHLHENEKWSARCKQLEREVDEQEATIRKLQDLCGQSDYENAKLREEVNLLRPTNLEQYEQIQKLQEENEKLKERRDYWSKKTKEFIYYFNCLEKAIEKTFDSDDQCFEEIWKHYDEMEKKWEYNDSFVGNWTDKPVLLERKIVNINENRDKQRLLAKQGKGISRRE